MRNWGRSLGVVSLALAVGGAPRSSRAQLVAIAPADAPNAIAHAELAYAEGQGAPVTWLSLRVRRGPVAVVAALPRDAAVKSGLDAWFASLEATASPNVLLPKNASDCGKTSSFAHVSWPRAAGAPANELELATRTDVVAALDEQGLTTPSELPDAERYLVWWWADPSTDQTTRTLRIEGGAAPLSLLPGALFPVLLSTVTRGPKTLPAELTNDALKVKFVAGKASSDYVDRLQDWFETRSEPLLETRANGSVFDWSIYSDTVSVRSLVESYVTAAAQEQPDLDVAECTRQLRALSSADAASPTACGDATDFSSALLAVGPEPTLQRFVVAGALGVEPSTLRDGGQPNSPVVRASSLDDSACVIDAPPPPLVVDPPPRSGGSGTGSTGTTTVVVEQTVVVDDPPPSAEISCFGSPGSDPYYDDRESSSCGSDTSSEATDDSSCSGDSSSSSQDSGCSSDSSSSSDRDNGCGSDSSSSSDRDNGCGSDSSSSSDSSDTSCSGGSEDSSYDGDTCTGSAAPGAERSQKAQARLTSAPRAARPRRVKTSLWSLSFVALVLPIRRLKRGRRRSG